VTPTLINLALISLANQI